MNSEIDEICKHCGLSKAAAVPDKKYKSCSAPIGEYCSKHGVVHKKKTRVIDYACGHEGKPIVMDNNVMSIAAWYDWRDTVGFKGTKEKCWECFCKESDNK